MINASASYHLYEIEQQELLRQLELRRVQLERDAESTPAPSRLRRAISRLTAVRTNHQPAVASAPCPDPA
jgi:hypothetical protein